MVNESKNMYIPEDTLENHQGNLSICIPSVWKLCRMDVMLGGCMISVAGVIIMGMTRGCTQTPTRTLQHILRSDNGCFKAL